MANFTLHTSNRQEILSQKLSAWLAASPVSDPFIRETIVVQSLGMRRWLQMEIAHQNGICTQIDFPFPQSFFHTLLAKCFTEKDFENHAFSRENLRWRIYAWLQKHSDRWPAEIQTFLAKEPSEIKTWQLASHTAQIFDDYAAYRPDWLQDWQKNRGAGWQEILWYDLTKEHPDQHLPALQQRFFQELHSLPPELFPTRLAVFGLATLPPAYLDLLTALSQRSPVDLFVLQPTDQFWGDLETGREISRRRKRGLPPKSEGITWNPLLASLGKTGRDYFAALWKIEDLQDDPDFATPKNTTLLGRLQSSLLNPEKISPEPLDSDPSRSIQIHSCPGPMREVEIFRDRLLDLFEQMPDLQPRDVLVMTPALDTYAPMIEAVFGSPEASYIPYSLADRTSGNPHTPGAVLLTLITLASGRVTVPEVKAFLEIPPIREKLAFSLADLEMIQDWTQQTGIRWGFDASHRKNFDLPAFGENSWEFGLDRLLLGFAMPPPEEGHFFGIAPVSVRDKSSAAILGRLSSFIDWLRQFHLALQRPRSLSDWSLELRRRLDFLFPSGAFTAFDPTTTVLEQMAEADTWLASDSNPLISGEVLREYLSLVLTVDETQVGYLNGGVTFCACRPMRSIPARVIALLGMNDGEFPRRVLSSQINRMTTHPRPGDRSRREDDRYLFLETILSARDVLYLSYTGRSANNGTDLLPSSIVIELGDYLDDQFPTSTPGNWSKRILVKHPLHGFSPEYFQDTDTPLFSYSSSNLAAATALLGTKTSPGPWFSQSLPALDAPYSVSVTDFVSFFQNPAAYFLRERLGISYKPLDEAMEDNEPFTIDGLVRYQLRDDGIRNPVRTFEKWKAQGVLTPGQRGRDLAREVFAEADALKARLSPYLAEAVLADLPINIALESITLTGTIIDLRSGGLLITQHGSIRTKHLLSAWIKHLVVNTQSMTVNTRLLGKDQGFLLKALSTDDALEHLALLASLFLEGLNRPLPFFPETSRAWQEKAHEPTKQRSAADAKWTVTPYQVYGESSDLSYSLCFSHLRDVFTAEFSTLAAGIFEPLLANLEEISDAS